MRLDIGVVPVGTLFVAGAFGSMETEGLRRAPEDCDFCMSSLSEMCTPFFEALKSASLEVG